MIRHRVETHNFRPLLKKNPACFGLINFHSLTIPGHDTPSASAPSPLSPAITFEMSQQHSLTMDELFALRATAGSTRSVPSSITVCVSTSLPVAMLPSTFRKGVSEKSSHFMWAPQARQSVSEKSIKQFCARQYCVTNYKSNITFGYGNYSTPPLGSKSHNENLTFLLGCNFMNLLLKRSSENLEPSEKSNHFL